MKRFVNIYMRSVYCTYMGLNSAAFAANVFVLDHTYTSEGFLNGSSVIQS
jgi:hypothetical protein